MDEHEPRDRGSVWYLAPRMAWAALALAVAPVVAIALAVLL